MTGQHNLCYDSGMLSIQLGEPLQSETESVVTPKPLLAPKSKGAYIQAPVIPEGVPLRCRFDDTNTVWRCSYEGWFRQPGVYMMGAAALAGLVAGFLYGSRKDIRQAVREVRTVSPI